MFTRKQILSGGRINPYERIFGRVKESPEGCLEFQGGKDIHGYGKIKVLGHQMGVHKVAYILTKGEIPAGDYVMHSCDNPCCVNPNHLSLGTQSENILDCVRKNRRKSVRIKNRRLVCFRKEIGYFYPSIKRASLDGYTRCVVGMRLNTDKLYKGFIWK